MATLITSQISHAREDLTDIISTVDPTETPFFSSIKKTKATNIRHEWHISSLADPNPDNAFAEGASAVDSVMQKPERRGNVCQIFQKDIRLSGTIQAVNTAGAKTEKARLTKDRGLEIRRDIEAAFLRDTGGTVDSEPRKLGGYQAWCSTNGFGGANSVIAGYSAGNAVAPVAGTARALTEDMFLDMFESIYEAGGRPTEILAGPKLKRKISSFQGGGTKFQAADKKTINQGVDLYATDYGQLTINPHPYALTKTVIAYDPKYWAAAFLRSFKFEEIGKLGDSDVSLLTAEVTLEAQNEKTSGQVRDLNG